MATAERQEVQAVAKWVRMSPRKARLVVDHIRGRSVPEARTVLAFTPRAPAREVETVLSSAVANAEANHNLVGDDLVVSPVMKRWRARARGRAARIRKPTCHITVRLTPLDGAPAPAPEAVPRTEEPKIEEPKIEEPKAEEPKAENPEQKPAPKRKPAARKKKTEEAEA